MGDMGLFADQDESLQGSRLQRQRLGKYDLIAKLGRGGMADVYLAVARGAVEGFRKLVVLKVLHENLSEDPIYVDMFTREAKLAARLTHTNVVHTFTVGQEDGRFCIIMEYLDGVSLAAVVKRAAQMPMYERLTLLGAVVRALAGLHYVHEFQDYDGTHRSLIHRDIKPANIFITFDGQVKVLDFGVAKMTATNRELTASEVVKGTVQYMAPEALDITRPVDRRVDVFAAGIVAWELVQGTKFWQGYDHLHVLRFLASGQLPPLDGIDGTPERLIQICRHATSVTPDARPATALELKIELEAFLTEYGIPHGTEDLAQIVRRLYDDLRTRRTQAIRERLEAFDRQQPLPPSTLLATDSSSLTSLSPPPLHGEARHSMTTAPRLAPPQEDSRSRRRSSIWAVAFGVPVAAAAVFGVTRFGPWSSTEKNTSPETPAITNSSMYSIQIKARPATAALTLDGAPLPGNPATIIGRPADPSSHQLTLSAPGYLDRTVQLALDRPGDYEFVLDERSDLNENEPVATGQLEIKSMPAGTVFINDILAGTTPLLVEIETGSHSIRVEAAEYAAWTRELDIAASEIRSLDISLRKPDSENSSSSPHRRPAKQPRKPQPSSPSPPEPTTSEVSPEPAQDEPAGSRFKRIEAPKPKFRKLKGKQLKAFGK